MAWEPTEWSCGHKGSMQLYGKGSGRRAEIAKAAGMKCMACWLVEQWEKEGDKRAKREDRYRLAADIAENKGKRIFVEDHVPVIQRVVDEAKPVVANQPEPVAANQPVEALRKLDRHRAYELIEDSEESDIWIQVRNIDIHIVQEAEGVVVDLWSNKRKDAEPCKITWLSFKDAD